ncbi:dihydrolipoyl dehydrogenase family protein [Marivirga harenae]|jgi:glutathione reductase (NADPH)|uniref:dihydrolipoyl dehydrogenase family protein n=1 Tax=Marivirga harenae TaxID=2010992 RepID=UPI0026DEAB2C|nr:NAD(P)/FAD-dependent oxidoreductase [Marivirga harenae]WKV12409.1 NAD(P)/FAD-dependent oxidoreductase [Marivirga harenae]
MKKYDLFVIGSGMAGMNIANRCASKGLKVGITDELPYGGTCALRGCDPKKIMLAATELRHFATNLEDRNISDIPEISWKAAMKSKQEFVEIMPAKLEKGYEKNGVETFHSSARFIKENQLKVGDEIIEAAKIVIATGAKARHLDFPGGDLTLTSTDFLNFENLPKSLIFIGGGYIAFEFAHMAARYGSKVTIIHRGERPLENFDPFIVEQITKATEELDIELILNTDVSKIEKSEAGYKVTANPDGNEKNWEAEVVINSAGRLPAIFDLDLDKGNVKFTQKGIVANEYLQSTSNPNVYVAGDAAATDGKPLTPVAVMEGHIVASNILKENSKKPDYSAIPTVVFTSPAMASVGLSEEQANQMGLDFIVKKNSIPNWFTAKRLNEKTYAFKTLIEKDSGKILGAHLTGPHAEEVINLFAMAIKGGLTSKDIKTMILTYPSASSDIVYMV